MSHAYQDPRVDPPPLGVTLLLFTKYGTHTTGKWEEGGVFLGWAHRPQVPDEMKERVAFNNPTEVKPCKF